MLVNKKQVLLYILKKAFLKEIIEAGGRVEAAAKVNAGPLESTLGELNIGGII